MPDVVLRPAIASDIPVLGQLGAMMTQMHHSFDPQRFFAPTPGTPEGYGRWLESQLGEASVVIIVAERADAVVGYAYGAIEPKDWMSQRDACGAIHDIIVAPAARGAGIGRQLLGALTNALTKLGAPRVVLATAQKNEAAQRLFESAGFRRTMVEMTKEL